MHDLDLKSAVQADLSASIRPNSVNRHWTVLAPLKDQALLL